MAPSKRKVKMYRKRVKRSPCHSQTSSTCNYLKKTCKQTRHGKRSSYCRRKRNLRRTKRRTA